MEYGEGDGKGCDGFLSERRVNGEGDREGENGRQRGDAKHRS